MAKERRGETFIETKEHPKGVRSLRFSKHALYRVICIAYDSKLSLKENRELGCKKEFDTRNPDRIYCSDECRLRMWTKNNKDKIAKKQQRYRDNQKKKFEELVQTLVDEKGVQEN